LLDPTRADITDLILLTDGDDHGTRLEEAARAVSDAGVRLIVVGLGDSGSGARIPLTDPQTGDESYLQNEGKDVWTRLHRDRLEPLALAAPNGLYVDVGTGVLDLRDVYRRILADAPGRMMEGRIEEAYRDLFPWFLYPALGLLILAGLRIPFGRWRVLPGAAVVIGCLIVPATMAGDSVRETFANGVGAYRKKDYESAITAFRHVADQTPQKPEVWYNLGCALYQKGDNAAARRAFATAAMETSDSALRARGLLHYGHTLIRNAAETQAANPDAALLEISSGIRAYRSALALQPEWREAAAALEAARRLSNALTRRIQKDKQQNQQSKKASLSPSDEGDSSDDGDYSPSEDASDSQEWDALNQPFGDFSDYEEIRGVPPPNLSPRDILDEAVRDHAWRKKQRHGQYKNVKLDW
jgi:tetratricopeptide (TPR) repeat protein